ncbi:MAG: hypothetical protein KatS3mg062_0229 [Tepidiforma sp.]|nr:MAG: hypothetical protein KatS3mg062_0229 [Tepidiforma sp.]
MSRIYEIAHLFIEELAASDPVAATMMGVQGHDDRLTDHSPEGYARLRALRRRYRQMLETAPVESDRDRVARDGMLEYLELRDELDSSGEQYYLSGFRNPATTMRMVFDLMPRSSEDDWAAIALRFAAYPAALARYRVLLEEAVARGFTSPRRQVAEAIRQLRTYGGAEGKSYFRSLAESAPDSLPDSLRSELLRGADDASRAMLEFSEFLAGPFSERSGERDAVGRDRYRLNARAFNGIDLDLEETYAWGWEELHRIEAEMAATCQRILPGASIPETKEFLERDPSRSIEGVDAFRQWMQDLQDRTIAELDGKHFDIPEPVKRIEAMIAPPGGAAAMYYTGPSEDFSRPGRTWYPTGGRTRFPLWGEVSIAYHEGVPGHHLERANAKYLADRLSRFQRLLGGTSGYVEGWALYAERLMAELGYLDVPDYYLGMLRAQALRAVRVIVDIGMHLELEIPRGQPFHPGERWNAALGQEFCNERSQFPLDFVQSEVIRYLGMPGQAISYKVGERCWLEAREEARQRLGAKFDLKAWHRTAFDLGPMGLAQMQAELRRAAPEPSMPD